MKKTNIEILEQISQLYSQNLKLSEISNKLEISITTVFNYLQRNRLLRPYKIGSASKLEDAKILSREEFMNKYNCTVSPYYVFKRRVDNKDYDLMRQLGISLKYSSKITNKTLLCYQAIVSGIDRFEFMNKFGFKTSRVYYKHRHNLFKLRKMSRNEKVS